MSDESYIQSLFSERVGGSKFGKDTKIYKFEKIKRANIFSRLFKSFNFLVWGNV